MKRTCLTLDDKIKVLDYRREHPKTGVRDIATHFYIGKTAAANIINIKNAKKLREDYETFKGTYKKRRHGKYHLINEIVYKWYSKCCSLNISPYGEMIQEEALKVKERLSEEGQNFQDFTASNGWLESFKDSYGIRETRIVGEGDDVSVMTVKSWLERLPELTKGFAPQDIINMDEFAVFFRALPDKGLREKGKSSRGGKNSKLRITCAIFVSLAGDKVCEPIVIGRSKHPRCFKKLKDRTRPLGAQYFSSKKAWMNTEIMETVLRRLDRKFANEDRNVRLFLDNATCHPPTLQDGLIRIELKFLPKNTTSKLQPCDAGIIQSTKSTYRKLLLRHVISRIDEDKRASTITEEIDVLMTIRWIMNAWQTVVTIVKCFDKCGFKSSSTVPSDSNDEMDNEFLELYKELTVSSSSTDIEEFIDFDRNVETCESAVDISSVAWREELREQCVQSVIGEPSVQAESSDDDDDIELVSVRELPVQSAAQVLKMLDSIRQFVDSKSESMELNASVEELIHSVEKLKLKNQKQGDIRSYVM